MHNTGQKDLQEEPNVDCGSHTGTPRILKSRAAIDPKVAIPFGEDGP